MKLKNLLLACVLALGVMAVAPAQAAALCTAPDAVHVGDTARSEYNAQNPNQLLREQYAALAGIEAMRSYVWYECLSWLTYYHIELRFEWWLYSTNEVVIDSSNAIAAFNAYQDIIWEALYNPSNT